MIYLLLGKDDFSKKEYIDSLKEKEKAVVLDFNSDSNEADIMQAAMNSSLFDNKKIIRVFDLLSKIESEEFIDKIKGTSNSVVFLENSLDKRKTETKKILANKNIKVEEFDIPSGDDFKKWVVQRAKKYELTFTKEALELFLDKMGMETSSYTEARYSLWQVNMELKKLKTYVGEKQITAKDVSDLVPENLDENVFNITNAIADKDKESVAKYLTDYFDRLAGIDDKSKIISFSGLLSEQLRGILAIQNLLVDRAADAEIAKILGYSPGRLHIYKRMAQRFQNSRVLEGLKKLEILDQETKTSNNPASLQFMMILTTIMA